MVRNGKAKGYFKKGVEQVEITFAGWKTLVFIGHRLWREMSSVAVSCQMLDERQRLGEGATDR
jgi:hypothetical protein